MADALPRERWILTAGVLFVVLGGLFPNAIVARWAAEAETVEQAFYAPGATPLTSRLVSRFRIPGFTDK